MARMQTHYSGFAAAAIGAINIAVIVAVKKLAGNNVALQTSATEKLPKEGLIRRDRQKAYRQRRAAVSVMDQGSHNEVSAGTIISPVISHPVAAYTGSKTIGIHDPGVPYCMHLRPDKPVCESLSLCGGDFYDRHGDTRPDSTTCSMQSIGKSEPLRANWASILRLSALAVETDRFNNTKTLRPSATDPYADFIREILAKHPRLRATRIFQMIRDRGYSGSIVQLRRFVACIRPAHREAFLRLHTFPGEQGQVDWAHFGEVSVGRARRRLSCFVITLSYSRALYLEFFFDQSMESFLRGHIHAFEDWQGFPRILLYDNLRSVVLERRGDAIHFHPRLLELCAHYHFDARPCQVARRQSEGTG